ncbi:Card1-like endonuclease domain-containing protein [Ammonifex degensii]
MVCLVSEERMQNIIPVFQRGLDISEVYLICSRDAEQENSPLRRALHDLQATLESEASVKVKVWDQFVDAYDPESARRVVYEAIKDARKRTSAQVLVNFTGGTKCMSVGAFLAAQDVGVPCLYVDTANLRLIRYDPGALSLESLPFDLAGRLTVPIYLRSYGKLVHLQPRQLLPAAFDFARDLYTLWPQRFSVIVSSLEKFARAISTKQTMVEAEGLNEQLVSLLLKYGAIKQSGNYWEVVPDWKPVLGGGKWLEAMVFLLLKESGHFDDIATGICVAGLENELDVVMVRHGQLAVIECKIGSLKGALPKVRAVATALGRFARSFIVTSQLSEKIPPVYKARAIHYGVRDIVTAEDLPRVAEKVIAGMRGGR